MKRLLRDSIESYTSHEGSILAAAVALYALLAAAPFGVFALAIVGIIYGADDALREIREPLQAQLGADVAAFIVDMIERSNAYESGGIASLLGVFFFLMATSKVFVTLRWALNHVFSVRPTVMPGIRGVGLAVLRRRMLAVVMVFICGFMFSAFVLVKTALVAAVELIVDLPRILQVAEFVLSWVMLSGACTLVYRFIPDATIAWEDALVGATVTAFLSGVGSSAVGEYLVRFGTTSAYGAAGSLVAFLLWVYYTAQIFLFGAEFTASWAHRRGAGIVPLPHAVRVEHDARASLLSEPPPP